MIIGDLNDAGGQKIASTNPTQITHQNSNVATKEGWAALVATAKKKFGRLDIVINNAGTSYANKPTLEVTEQEYDSTMDVNVKSIFWSVNQCIPAMLESGNGGAMLNVASVGATRPRPGLVWYAVSKGAVWNVSLLLILPAFFCFSHRFDCCSSQPCHILLCIYIYIYIYIYRTHQLMPIFATPGNQRSCG